MFLDGVDSILEVVLHQVRVSVQGDVDGFVAHELLNRLDVHARADEVAGEAVPEFVVVGSIRIQAGLDDGGAERADACCVVGERACGHDGFVRVPQARF